MAKSIVAGFDFDGVIAYNPARLARKPIALIKRNIFGMKKVRFFVPKTPLEKTFWSLAHETSMFPSMGASKLRSLVKEGRIEAHLLTSRFGFLEPNLRRFLRIWNLDDVFRSITLNHNEEQPHEFKARILSERKFAYFVEDNWDIVTHLQKQSLKTEIHWIYNLFDRTKEYPYKYPYLDKSLERIVGLENFKA